MTTARPDNSRAFTIIELMVVTLIIAILMSIAFKISGIGDERDRRTRTVERLQRLENCLSGYYAAYGMYPPVPLQGVSRNIYLPVNINGIQGQSNAETGGGKDSLVWERVKAACLAQPVAVTYPYPEAMNDTIKSLSDLMEERYSDDDDENVKRKFSRGFTNASDNMGKFESNVDTGDSPYRGQKMKKSPNWNDCQLFRYGLLSFLLPRYLFMMGGNAAFYEGDSARHSSAFAQWHAFNIIPPNIVNGKHFDVDNSGRPRPRTFRDLRSRLNYNQTTGEIMASRDDLAEVEAYPSQSICRRWLSNLEGIVSGGMTFYGINTRDKDGYNGLHAGNRNLPLYEVHGQQYVLGEMTVCDGWGNPIYYYSEPPYQSYRLWSGGPNIKDKNGNTLHGPTIPPWISLKSLPEADREEAAKWMADDIIMMSN